MNIFFSGRVQQLVHKFCSVLNNTACFTIVMAVFFTAPVLAQTFRYPHITAKATGVSNPLSPDPIFNYVWENPKAADDLETYLLKPSATQAVPQKSFIVSSDAITVKGPGYLRFDFGRTNAGWLEFESDDLNGDVTMGVSEFNEPAVKNASYPPKTAIPKKLGNTYRLELNAEWYEGVRYGWINIISLNRAWHIKNLRLVCQIKPTNYNGSFACSDSMITRIWYTGAYTVKLNLLKDYFGAILMNRGDRFSWTGDAHPAQAAAMVAFANYDFVKQNIAYTSTQSNGIRSYALYWVLSLLDYYKYTGDLATLDLYVDNACKKMDDAYNEFGTNPHLEFYGWDERLGAGFEHPNLPETQNAYKMLSIRVWHEFAQTMALAGNQKLHDKYEQYALQKINQLKQADNWTASFGLHAGADAITTQLLSATEQNSIYQQAFTDRVNRLSYSPFNQFFILQAYAQLNKYNEALATVNDLWGGQIRYGGTTFFEDYRPSWNSLTGKNGPVPNNQCGFTSLCHPWGAGVTKWLSEEVLGIKPLTPGFKQVQIKPHLGTVLHWVSGRVTTPHGAVSAAFNTNTGQCKVIIPQGVTGNIALPKAGKKITAIKINGGVAWLDNTALSAEYVAKTDDEYIYLQPMPAGTYNIAVTYSGKAKPFIDVKTKYKASVSAPDLTTSGNWSDKYGKDGFVLCNYYGDGKDKSSLPAFVSNVTYYKKNGNNQPLNCVWEQQTNDKRALAPDKANDFPRTAACLYAMDADQVGFTFTTTISLKKNEPYKISLYVLDWDKNGRSVAIEAFDANTLELIAPVKIINDCKNGAYITYAYNKSIKFRMNIVRGINPVLSGIFFDH